MKYIPYIVIAFLVGVIIFGDREVDVKETHTTDTDTVVLIDTVYERVPSPVETRILERKVYVKTSDTVYMFNAEQKRYTKEGSYDIWISGCEPNLDSCKVYNKTEYRTVNNEIVKVVPESKYHIYANGGFSLLNERLIPQIGISISSPGKLTYGAKIGLYDGSPLYGISIGYKIK